MYISSYLPYSFCMNCLLQVIQKTVSKFVTITQQSPNSLDKLTLELPNWGICDKLNKVLIVIATKPITFLRKLFQYCGYCHDDKMCTPEASTNYKRFNVIIHLFTGKVKMYYLWQEIVMFLQTNIFDTKRLELSK